MAEPTADLAAEERLLTAMLKSRYWRYLVAYLLDRREKLYHGVPKDMSELWMKEGAVREINQLLRAPSLILEWRKAAASMSLPANGDDAATSSPRAPSFVLPADDL